MRQGLHGCLACRARGAHRMLRRDGSTRAAHYAWPRLDHGRAPPGKGPEALANVVRVVSPEWLAWISNGPRRRHDPWKVVAVRTNSQSLFCCTPTVVTRGQSRQSRQSRQGDKNPKTIFVLLALRALLRLLPSSRPYCAGMATKRLSRKERVSMARAPFPRPQDRPPLQRFVPRIEAVAADAIPFNQLLASGCKSIGFRPRRWSAQDGARVLMAPVTLDASLRSPFPIDGGRWSPTCKARRRGGVVADKLKMGRRRVKTPPARVPHMGSIHAKEPETYRRRRRPAKSIPLRRQAEQAINRTTQPRPTPPASRTNWLRLPGPPPRWGCLLGPPASLAPPNRHRIAHRDQTSRRLFFRRCRQRSSGLAPTPRRAGASRVRKERASRRRPAIHRHGR